MIYELAREEEFWARKNMISSTSDYRKNLENLAKEQVKSIDNVQRSIDMQTVAIVASQAALANTVNQGFNQLDNTLNNGFSEISNQLGSMSASISRGFLNLENTIDRMNAQICDRLDALYNAMVRPLLVKTREYYHIAAESYKGGHFDDALDYIKKALDEYKTDYISWFLQGKIYAFGASKHSNVVDLDKAIESFQNAEKYVEQYTGKSDEARNIAAEICFNLGKAQFSKSNDLILENKKNESDEMLAKAKSSFERSYAYSNKMLEAFYEFARCKNLQGETGSTLKDLEALVQKDRNYCFKVKMNPDFTNIKEQFDDVINNLKNTAFIPAKENYDRLNNLISELKSLGGSTTVTIPSTFANDLPYFDVLDYAANFNRDIPVVEKEVFERRAYKRQRELEKEEEESRKERKRREKELAEAEARAAKKEAWKKRIEIIAAVLFGLVPIIIGFKTGHGVFGIFTGGLLGLAVYFFILLDGIGSRIVGAVWILALIVCFAFVIYVNESSYLSVGVGVVMIAVSALLGFISSKISDL